MSRDRLIVRLGLDRDGNSGRAALRLRIDDLRYGVRTTKGEAPTSGIGAEHVLADRDTLAVAPERFHSDIELLRNAVAHGDSITDPSELVTFVERLPLNLAGRFLEGVDRDNNADQWLLRTRRETDALVAQLWTQVGTALRDLGRRADAHDAFRRAYERYPENADLIAELLETVGDSSASWLGHRAGPLDTLVHRLPQENARGNALTVGDRAILQSAVRERLNQLSRRTVAVLEKLAQLPVSLPVETIERWLDLDPADLERAVDAFPIILSGGELRLHRDVGYILRDLCAEERRDEIHRELIERIESDWTGSSVERPFEIPSELGIQLLEWVVSREFPIEIPFLHHLLRFARPFSGRQKTPDFIGFLENIVPAGPNRHATYSNLLMAHHIHADRFALALEAGLEFLERFGPHPEIHWYYLLLAAHHAQDDACLDRVGGQCLEFLCADEPDRTPAQHRRLSDIHCLLAENSLARNRIADADRHNRAAIHHAEASAGNVGPLSRMLSQQAQIDAESGQPYTEVAKSWEKALASYQTDGNREGEAECLRAMGQLASSQGLHSLGKTLIERAIELFETENKPDSVNATEGALARVLAAAGNAEAALAILDRCVAYWTAKGHARWTGHFELERERVGAMLSQQAG